MINVGMLSRRVKLTPTQEGVGAILFHALTVQFLSGEVSWCRARSVFLYQ